MEHLSKRQAGMLRIAAVLLTVIVVACVLRRFAAAAVQISAQAAGMALILSPLCRLFEKKFSRGISAVLAILAAAIVLITAASTIPIVVSSFLGGAKSALEDAMGAFESLSGALAKWGIDISGGLKRISEWIAQGIPRIMGALSGAISTIGSLAIAAALCFFMLRDREKLLLHAELMIPRRWREKTVRCASASYSDIMLYFRAQLIISACVGLLSAFGLFIIGLPGAIPLGFLAGVFNIIPYLGPIIAAVPVGISALSCGLPCALMAIGVLIAVQQIDGLIISPRVMGSVTGFSPAVVMLAVFCAGAAAGILGMLIILPLMIVTRTCFRVFVESH